MARPIRFTGGLGQNRFDSDAVRYLEFALNPGSLEYSVSRFLGDLKADGLLSPLGPVDGAVENAATDQ